jgi:hypothetical protein
VGWLSHREHILWVLHHLDCIDDTGWYLGGPIARRISCEICRVKDRGIVHFLVGSTSRTRRLTEHGSVRNL